MSKETILVVDDEKNIVELARIYLEKEDYHVEDAYDGAEALAKVKSVQPALVVLDLMLPEIDGWEVCRRLCDLGRLDYLGLAYCPLHCQTSATHNRRY